MLWDEDEPAEDAQRVMQCGDGHASTYDDLVWIAPQCRPLRSLCVAWWGQSPDVALPVLVP